MRYPNAHRRTKAEELIAKIKAKRAAASKVVMPRHDAIAVIASGPSLAEWQTDYLADKIHCIATNSSFRRLKVPGDVYGCDRIWWDHYAADVRAAGHSGWTQDRGASMHHQIRWVRAIWCRGLGVHPGVIHHGANSGYQAINLAFQFGARRIILVGFDMQKTGGVTHWYGDHPSPMKNAGGIEGWVKNFSHLSRDLRAHGVEVFNCTVETALDCFEHADLRDVL
jgi:hypothetical protein